MSKAIVFLILGYCGLLVLLLNLGLYTRWPAWVKTACILLFGALAFKTYESMSGLLGWPTTQELPEQFVFVAAWVDEPDQQDSDDGVIHIWAIESSADGPASLPRAYTLQYDRNLHQQINNAMQRARQGIRQIGRRKSSAELNPALTTSSRFASDASNIEIYDLPDPQLPEK